MYLPDEFDYIKLMGLGRDPSEADDGSRVAVLGFCTTDYYAAVLRGLGRAGGFPIVTYEPEYNTVHQTVLDEQSPLYSFQPDFVIFLTAVQALRNVLLSEDVSNRTRLAEREAEQLVSLVRQVAGIPGVTVVVNEFVVPYERAWGNFSARVDGSLPNVVKAINERLRAV